jgi:hypothetical protein
MKTLAVMLLAVLGSTSAWAAPLKLGETDLRDAKDWDRVDLPPCDGARNVPVTALGLRVTRHPAEINRLKVEFYNGQTEELEVRHRFAPGSTSRWIDLPGEARCVKSIRIVGDAQTLGWRPGAQAHVAFWARAPGFDGDDADAGPPAPPAPAAPRPGPAAGADGGRLGAVQLRDRKDWDLLRLGACSGGENFPVTHLKLRVRDFPAGIDRLTVTYGNGATDELPVRERFAAGSESRWIDLRGEARCITSIRIIGDTKSIGWQPGKQSTVVFFGKNGG